MKTKTLLATMTVALICSLTFSSCSDDHYYYDNPWYDYGWYDEGYDNPSNDRVAMANMIRGHWSGQTRAQFYNSYGEWVDETYDTEIEFDQYSSGAVYGRGVQYDYYNGELDLQRTFSWGVDQNGNIYITYDGDDGSSFTQVIDYDDLSLDSDYFTGTAVGDGETDYFSWQRYTYAKTRADKGQTPKSKSAKRQ